MRGKLFFVLGMAVSLVAYGQKPQHDLVIRDITIIDVVAGKANHHQTIGIDGNRISKIYPRVIDFPASTKTIDGKGLFVTPGLFDCHMHCAAISTESEAYIQEQLLDFVLNGVLYMRDVGGPVDRLQALSQRIHSGELIGPALFYAGPMLESTPLFWASNNEELPGFTLPLDSQADVDSLLPVLAQKGACMIKTFGAVKAALYPYVVEVARRNNLKVVHDPGVAFFNSEPMGKALTDGATSIEHAQAAWGDILKDEYREALDSLLREGADNRQKLLFMFKMAQLGIESVLDERLDALCALMKAKQAVYCPTLTVSKETLAEFDKVLAGGNNDERLVKNRILQMGLDRVDEYVVKAFSEKGVRVLVGQDNGNPQGTVNEMVYLRQAGMSNLEVLRGATLYPAEWLGVSDRCGSIEASKMANLVILTANPLEDISNMKSVCMVVHQGKVLKR